MTSYVDDNLIPGETVLHRAHKSAWALSPYIALGVGLIATTVIGTQYFQSVALWGLLALAALCFLCAYVIRSATEFAVTDKRIIAKTGLVSRKTVEVFLDKVESMNVDQSVMGRLLNFGTVTVVGTGSTHDPITTVSAPMALRKQVMAAADKYRTTLRT